MSKDAPLFVDLRIFPERPATINTPEPERLSDVLSLVVAVLSVESSLLAQEMMADGPIQDAPSDRILLAMGFTFAHPEIDTAIIGTKNHGHMLSNIEMVDSLLPISNVTVSQLHEVFAAHDSAWIQQI